jgi:hypothetical protein
MSVKVGVKLDTGKARNIWRITTGALMLVKISRLMRKQGATWKERKKFHVRKKKERHFKCECHKEVHDYKHDCGLNSIFASVSSHAN